MSWKNNYVDRENDLESRNAGKEKASVLRRKCQGWMARADRCRNCNGSRPNLLNLNFGSTINHLLFFLSCLVMDSIFYFLLSVVAYLSYPILPVLRYCTIYLYIDNTIGLYSTILCHKNNTENTILFTCNNVFEEYLT